MIHDILLREQKIAGEIFLQSSLQQFSKASRIFLLQSAVVSRSSNNFPLMLVRMRGEFIKAKRFGQTCLFLDFYTYLCAENQNH